MLDFLKQISIKMEEGISLDEVKINGFDYLSYGLRFWFWEDSKRPIINPLDTASCLTNI